MLLSSVINLYQAPQVIFVTKAPGSICQKCISIYDTKTDKTKAEHLDSLRLNLYGDCNQVDETQ